jgi:hypothetical protein
MGKWHKGPPPSVGWWPASWSRSDNVFRWWDGRLWSAAASSIFTARSAEKQAKTPAAVQQHSIEWTDRPADWPERSRT